MRQLDRQDAQPLGQAKPRAKPQAADDAGDWTVVKPGIERDKEGRLRTNIPANEGANPARPTPTIYRGRVR